MFEKAPISNSYEKLVPIESIKSIEWAIENACGLCGLCSRIRLKETANALLKLRQEMWDEYKCQ